MAAPATVVPTEMSDDRFDALVHRLNAMSIAGGTHFDAYLDVPWDDPACAIEPTDPRFELDESDPLGATAWYRLQPPETRAAIGLHMVASRMSKIRKLSRDLGLMNPVAKAVWKRKKIYAED